MRGKSKPNDAQPILSPGDKVLILANPHDPRAENIIGTVLVFRPRVGFGHSDLVEVHYKHPRDGRGITFTFGLNCLAEVTPARLILLAEHYERLAQELRQAAAQYG
jgi:hypothetical protein